MRTGRRTFLEAGFAALSAATLPGSSRAIAQERFPALRQRIAGRPLAYLDNAATTQRPREVLEALRRFYETDNANPSSSLHTVARRAATALAHARETVARFVNAASAAEIVFTRGTTEAINLLASTWGAEHVRAGDEIVLTVAEHASNMFPWQRVAARAGARIRLIDVEDDGRLDVARVESLLTSRTRLVAVTHVSNVCGIVNDVARICSVGRAAGAAVFVDAAQSAPHVPLDVQRLGADFLAFSSHKMLGPMGVGVLWARGDRLKEMPAYHVGSNMGHGLDIASAAMEPGALRFQAGTPDVAGPVALAAAIDVLTRIGFAAIAAQDRALASYGLSRLTTVPGLRLIGSAGLSTSLVPAPADRLPVFSFTLGDVPVPAIVAAADAAGIAIRGGDLAALPLLRRFGVSSAARASAYLYNTTEEVDRLVDVLTRLASSSRVVRG